LVVKQDNNGTTFVVTDIALPLPADEIEHHAQVHAHPIGAWTHPTIDDIQAEATSGGQAASPAINLAVHIDKPPF
jgi:hypothetical protein